MAKHGFGSAFAAAFMAGLKQIEDERHNRALEDHWARVDNKQTAAEIEAAGAEAARRRGEAGYTGGGGGAANVSKNLGANQNEAYQAAIDSGLSDSAARALVANMSGEALSDPSNVHQDGPHMAHGIVQWDDVRAARIEKQFGTAPQNMSVADQTKAAIWEMKTDPAYKASWAALNSNASPQDMVKTLVTNYERPGDPDKSINQRLQHLGALATNLGTKAAPTTEVASSTGYQGSGAAPATDRTGKVAQTGATAPTTPTKGPDKDKDKTPKPAATPAPDTVASPDGSYQTAGLKDIALTPEDAEKSRRDLEAHRVDLNAPREPDQDLRPKPAESAPLIQFGGVHPENIFQRHSGPTLGPVFGTTQAGGDPGPHGTGPDDQPPQESIYDRQRGSGAARPDGPVSERGIPALAGARPSAPLMGPTPTEPAPNTVRPDAPATGGLPLAVNTVRPEPPAATPAPPTPITNTVRPDAPPTVTARPSTVGEDNPATRNMPYVGETASGNQADPKGVYAPKPNPIAIDKGQRPDLTARSPATSANVPSKDAQPVSSPAIPSNPAGNKSTPGFVQVTAPNSNPTDRNRPQMTALDLSHLWGPNPPVSQRSQPAPTPAPTPALRACPSF